MALLSLNVKSKGIIGLFKPAQSSGLLIFKTNKNNDKLKRNNNNFDNLVTIIFFLVTFVNEEDNKSFLVRNLILYS